MNFDREWSIFALEAEHDAFGFKRIVKAHNDIVRELLALREAHRWLPIETAPKDSTHITVGTFPASPGHITITTAHWFDSCAVGAKSGIGEWALSVNFDGDRSSHGVEKPTHWRPLPAPPEKS